MKYLWYCTFYIYFVFQSAFNMTNKEHSKENKIYINGSSNFISLSGLSGILTGVYALAGAFAANFLVSNYLNPNSGISLLPISFLEYMLVGIAILVLIFSTLTAFIIFYRKAKRNKEKMWDASSKKLLLYFSLPLFIGGVFCILFYKYGFNGLIPSTMLIFYGLACLSASKYTFGEIRYLGIVHIIIGLISTQFTDYSLYFWAIGFGCIHIIYGIRTYRKSDK